MKMTKLDSLRNQIDNIDNQILDLLSKRFSVVNKIAEYKIENGLPFLDPKRKRELMEDKVTKAKDKNLPPDMVKRIYEIIHNSSVKEEKKLK